MVKKRKKFFNSFRIRIFVGTVNKRIFSLTILLRYSFICHQHKIFDDLCGNICFIRLYINRPACSVQGDLAFRKIKIDRPSVVSSFSQKSRQFFHKEKHGNQIFVFSAGLCISILQNTSHLVITHTTVYPDHCLCDLVRYHSSIFINVHKTA